MPILLTGPGRILRSAPGMSFFGAPLANGGGDSGGGSGVPGAPTGVAAALGATTIGLSWTPPSGASAQMVQFQPAGAPSWTAAAALSGTATGYTITGLASGTSYNVEIYASNEAGDGPPLELTDLTTTQPGVGELSNVAIMVVGQSNALFAFAPSSDSFDSLPAADLNGTAAAGLQFYLQATSAQVLDDVYATMVSGNGLYQPVLNGPNFTGAPLAGDFVLNPNQAGSNAPAGITSNNLPAALPSQMADPAQWVDPSQWIWGSPDGTNLLTWLTPGGGASSVTAADVRQLAGVWLFWHETDANHTYAEKSVFKSALLDFMAKVRGALGKSAEALPFFDWSMISSASQDIGCTMLLEVVNEIAADPANNFWIVLPQASDSCPRGCTYNADGTYSGGDGYHQDNIDYSNWVHRAMLPIARAIAASAGNADAIPATLGTGLGPRITGATLSGNVVTVTVAHDIGTDLILPLQAVNGVGWALQDGGTSGAPATIIDAVSADRIDATHLAITFRNAPSNPASACFLHYPYGNNRIGRGSAVTDNASTIARPAGWDAGAALGDALWDQNMPLQRPVTLSNGAATAGATLSPG
jgi:hypothetical protein